MCCIMFFMSILLLITTALNDNYLCLNVDKAIVIARAPQIASNRLIQLVT